MSDRPTRPVELQRRDGSVQPGLELLDQRRVDGPDDGPQQTRTVVAVSGGDDGVQQVDAPQAQVEPADERADLIESVLGDKVGGGGSE